MKTVILDGELKISMVTNTLEGVNNEIKEKWKKCKLKEVISNPEFLGQTVRLGDMVFDVKGVINEED